MVVSPNERFVARVLVVADADQRLLEQLHDGGEHFLARQSGLPAQARRGFRRMLGSACAKPIRRWYLVSSRTSRHFG